MTANQFRAALERLGLTQAEAARLLWSRPARRSLLGRGGSLNSALGCDRAAADGAFARLGAPPLWRDGGTLDIIASVGGALALVDLKTTTTGSAYPDSLIQLAAYKALWDENFPRERINGGLHLILLPKSGAAHVHKYYPSLHQYWSLFLAYRATYDIDRELSAPIKLAGSPIDEWSPRRVIRAQKPVPLIQPWQIAAE
jgi:hypothetical protein